MDKRFLAIASIFASFVVVTSIVSTSRRIEASPSDTQLRSLVIKGSDTEVQLVSNLVERFLENKEGIDISVTGGGSGAGIAALLNGEIDVANSSRDMKEEERTQAKERGIDIGRFTVATDGLTIVLHPENQVRSLSLEQISAIYRGKILNWKEVGGPDMTIALYGRQSTSGTYVFFRDRVLKDDYASTMRTMEGSQAIVDAVKGDMSGIGYVGVGYVKAEGGAQRSDLSVVTIATPDGLQVSPLDTQAVLSGAYPIARPIYQFVVKKAGTESLIHELLTFEMSKEGEEEIGRAGFYPITASDRQENEAYLRNLP